MSTQSNNPFDVLNERLQNIENLILKFQNSEPQQTEVDKQDDLMNIDEASEFLGLTKQTLYLMVMRRAIPYMKPSKRLYFSKKALTEYIKNYSVKTIAEVETEALNYKTK
jgi:excisionase family DNA binding protein